MRLASTEFVTASGASPAQLRITVNIEATKPDGFTGVEQRTVQENANTLGFDPRNTGFTQD